MVMRAVTEMDLRAEEFKNPNLKVEDLEFREDGKIVRKDRWEQACRSACGLLEMPRSFELGEMLNKLQALMRATRELSDDLHMGRVQTAVEANNALRHAMCWTDTQ